MGTHPFTPFRTSSDEQEGESGASKETPESHRLDSILRYHYIFMFRAMAEGAAKDNR
jgi:hypothetical protein